VAPIQLLPAVFAAILAMPPGDARPASDGSRVSFDRDVRSILAENCFACHGPDPAARKAGFRLDVRDSATRPAKDGLVPVVPGDPGNSELVRRIRAADVSDRMPPAETKKTLAESEKALLERWIAEGAEYEPHWAFVRPVRPSVPGVSDPSWVRNEVDAFILARLDAAGLKPSPEADRATLARRLHLDLLGLPPSVGVVESFESDPRPDAYERLVAAVLSSPRFGEKMAVQWMDLARFGDTNGYHFDSTREMWLWRDWVIDAFNADMPFDRFVIEQIAGDLLPDPTIGQLIASGFNRNTRFNEEGGADPEEFVVTYAKDRVNTLGQTFLGMTLGCAECHSHKYDPVTQREYYALTAYFNSIDEPMVSMNHGQKLPPLVKVPRPEDERALADLRKEKAALDASIAAALAEVEYAEPGGDGAERDRVEIVLFDDAVPAGATANPVEGENVAWEFAGASADAFVPASGERAARVGGAGTRQVSFRGAEKKLRVGPGDRLFAHVCLDPSDPPDAVMLQFHAGDSRGGWNHRAFFGEDVIAHGADAKGTAAHFRAGGLPAPGRFARLEVDAAAVGLFPGSVVNGLAFTTHGGTALFDRAGLVTATPQSPEEIVLVDDEAPDGAKLEGDSPWEWVEAPRPVFSGKRATFRKGTALTQHFFTDAARPATIREDDVLFAHVFPDANDPPRTVMLQWNDGAWEHRAYWGEDLVPWGKDGTASRRRMGELPEPGRWARLEVTASDVGLAPGAKVSGFAFTQVGGSVYWDRAGVASLSAVPARARVSLAEWEAWAPGDERVPADVREAAAVPGEKRTAEQSKLVRDHFLRRVFEGTRETFDPLEERRDSTLKRLAEVDAAIPTTMISRELPERRPAYVLERGDFLQRGEEVGPALPALFGAPLSGAPESRLGLARWLTGDENPLVARVLANRLFALAFGEGIVRSLGDFGTQGDPPSHGALLDWLATELHLDGWSVKELLRTLVTSAAYRQSSVVRPGPHDEVDPENRLLHRARRFRLSAEEVRDNALAVAGLLSEKIGGPSVMPYQPDDFYKGKKEDWPWETATGEDLWRRGLYTFWRRTCLHPSFAIFDAPSREQCVVWRARTNTPLQALTTMNDPTFVEAARVLAQSVLTASSAADDVGRLKLAFRRAVARPPSATETAKLREILDRERAAFAADPDGARALASFGATPRPETLDPVEHAAMTAVANVILNLDETVTRE